MTHLKVLVQIFHQEESGWDSTGMTTNNTVVVFYQNENEK